MLFVILHIMKNPIYFHCTKKPSVALGFFGTQFSIAQIHVTCRYITVCLFRHGRFGSGRLAVANICCLALRRADRLNLAVRLFGAAATRSAFVGRSGLLLVSHFLLLPIYFVRKYSFTRDTTFYSRRRNFERR